MSVYLRIEWPLLPKHACSGCNHIKDDHRVQFDFYRSGITFESPFKFQLGIGSKLKYLLNRDCNEIQISFCEPKPAVGFKSFNECFDIQGIYSTQKDIVEELIQKSEIYTESYKAMMVKDFKRLFGSSISIEKIITGNYLDEKDTHKRPLSKFTRDIAIEIGLLKELVK